LAVAEPSAATAIPMTNTMGTNTMGTNTMGRSSRFDVRSVFCGDN